MLIIVLTTTFAKAQPSVCHTHSVTIGRYSTKFKKWNYDPSIFIDLSIIFEESTIYVNDLNNSRYFMSIDGEERKDGDKTHYITKGLDEDKRDILIILTRNTVTLKRTLTIYWTSFQSAVIYDLKKY